MRKAKLLFWMATGVLTLAAPGSASGALTLGSTFNPTEECTPVGTTYVQTNSSTNAYVAPTDGVITSWAHRAGAEPPEIHFRVLRQRAGTSFFTLVGESASTPQIAFALNESPIRIPVRSGDAIGFLIGPSAAAYHCASTAITGEAEIWFYTPNPLGSDEALFVGPNHGYRFDISAQLEPDADRDGFGDETQDRCPNDASTEGACPTPSPAILADTDPPQTTITKRPPNKTDKRTVEFKMSSDEPRSTFQCKLDRQPWRGCASPKKVAQLDEGRHRFRARARDAAGNVDPSPAKDKFKVRSRFLGKAEK